MVQSKGNFETEMKEIDQKTCEKAGFSSHSYKFLLSAFVINCFASNPSYSYLPSFRDAEDRSQATTEVKAIACRPPSLSTTAQK